MSGDKNLLTGVGGGEQDLRSIDMGTWKTKDGREIRVSDMSDSHVLRTIALLERRIVDLGLSVPENQFDTEMRDLNIRESGLHLKTMRAEAERRNLSGWGKFGIELVQKVLE